MTTKRKAINKVTSGSRGKKTKEKISKYVGSVRECQVCSKKKLDLVLSLGHQPIVQEYLTKEALRQPEVTYPLNLVRCADCGLLQIDHVVDPVKVFPPQYPYRTGLTNMLIRNFRELADALERDHAFKKGDLIIDIGSNDGTLLQGFKDKGMKVLGVEPTGAAKVANKNGIKTIEDFFDGKVVKQILAKYGKAKIITATNVFAHINDTNNLARNIKALMGKDSIFVSESQYLMDIIEKLEFDTIYHEHLRFYAIRPLARLFERNGMSIIDAERISAAGGSIRVYAKVGKHSMSDRAKDLMDAEGKAGIYDEKTLVKFAEKIYKARHDLMSLLLQCKREGARIVGITSSARSNTLLGFTKINEAILDYACEKSGSPKIGLYTPGTHVPVVDESKLFEDQPEYALILSWHIGTELMKKFREAGYKGKFIIPLPVPQIVE